MASMPYVAADGERIILRTTNSLSYFGRYLGDVELDGKSHMLMVLDESLGVHLLVRESAVAEWVPYAADRSHD